MPSITLAHNAVVSLAGIDVTPEQTETILRYWCRRGEEQGQLHGDAAVVAS
jgi:hypothetical protein